MLWKNRNEAPAMPVLLPASEPLAATQYLSLSNHPRGDIINTIRQKDPVLLLSLKELFRDALCFRSPSQNLHRPFRQNDIC